MRFNGQFNPDEQEYLTPPALFPFCGITFELTGDLLDMTGDLQSDLIISSDLQGNLYERDVDTNICTKCCEFTAFEEDVICLRCWRRSMGGFIGCSEGNHLCYKKKLIYFLNDIFGAFETLFEKRL